MKKILSILLFTNLLFTIYANAQTVTKVLGKASWADDKVINNNANPVQPMLCNSLFYTGYDPEYGTELWAVDLDSDLSYMVKDIKPGSSSGLISPQIPVVIGDKIFFLVNGDSGTEIWQSDGSEQGTTKFLSNSGLEQIYELQLISNGNVFYFGRRNITNSVLSLFVSDGTLEGTKAVYKGIFNQEWHNPNISSGGVSTRFEGDNLHFMVNKYGSQETYWYKTNIETGTSSQVRSVFDYSNTIELNNNDYFISNDPSTNLLALYRFDGVSTSKIKALPSYSNSNKLTKVNGILYFFIGDDDYSNDNVDKQSVEIWRSDGTTAGTFRIKSFDTELPPFRWSSYEFKVVELNNKAYFLIAGNESQKAQIWTINTSGTSATLAVDISEHGDFMSNKFQSIGNYMYFYGYHDNDYRIWKTDGTPSGTRLLPNFPNGELAGAVILPSVNDHLIIPAFGDRSRQTRTFWHYSPDYKASHHTMNEFDHNAREFFLGSDVSCIKVCADGTESSVFKISGLIKGNGDLSNYELRIDQDLNGDTLTYGKFTILSSTSSELTVKYRHPYHLLSNGSNKNLSIRIYDRNNSNSATSIKFDLEVLPAAVLMVHGLWGKKSAFEEMEKQLNKYGYSKAITERADYEESNSYTFSHNLKTISDKISEFTDKVHTRGIACGKIDYIGHSMGGLLGRQYLESDIYRGDLRRIISINTPHSGSEFANAILESPALSTPVCRLNHCYNGAVDDLQTNSDALLALNNKTRQKRISIPSHAIATVAVAPKVTNSFRAIVNDDKVVYLATYDSFKEEIFGPNANDWIVAERSQTGGLTVKCTSRFSNQIHMGSPANQYVIARVVNLLSSSPDSDNFCPYFEPEDLSTSSTPSPLRIADTELIIKTPLDKAHVTEGSEMTFSLEGQGLEAAVLVVEYSPDSLYIAKITSSPFTIKLQTDKKYPGVKKFTVYGKFVSGEISVIEQSFILGPETALPLNLLSFTATNRENRIALKWKTVSEVNTDRFDIEMASETMEFKKVGSVPTTGQTTVSTNEYRFDFTEAEKGRTYYFRLKMLDKDGSFAYSKKISGRIGSEPATIVFPNPTSDYLKLESHEIASIDKIDIVDTKGNVLVSKTKGFKEKIDVTGLSNGAYFLKISKKDGSQISKQFLVQR